MITTQNSHYYDKDGNPKYDADLRVAKKENLLPSITTVLRIIYKEGLENWKMEKMIQSAITTPRLKDESDDTFIRRVVEGGQQEGSEAADFGSAIHDMIEKYIVDLDITKLRQDHSDKEIDAFFKVKEFIDKNIKITPNNYVEKSLPSKHFGFAGRIDFFGTFFGQQDILIDWKTQNVKMKEFKKRTNTDYEIEKNGTFLRPVPNFYDTFSWQLAAQTQLIFENMEESHIDVYSIIINSNPDYLGQIFVKEYTNEEIAEGWIAFKHCLNLWRIVKNFPYEVK